MKRIDRFRAMSAEELAEMLGYKACRWCSYYDEPNDKCSINIVTRNPNHCKVGITEGLNQDDNPIPEIKIGDVLVWKGDTEEMELFCVTDNTAYSLSDDICFTLTDRFKKQINLIARYDPERGFVKNFWKRDEA